MTALGGTSARQEAVSKRERARSLRAQADRLDAQADNWDRGAEGELITSTMLDALRLQGWAVLDDLADPHSRANIDHVLIGTGGIVVIDSKNYAGGVTLSNGVLRHNGWSLDGELDALDRYCQIVAEALGPAGVGVPVRGILCIHEAKMEGPVLVRGRAAVPAAVLVSWLRAQPQVLSLSSIPRLRDAIATNLGPRSQARSSRTPAPTVASFQRAFGPPTDASPPPATRPPLRSRAPRRAGPARTRPTSSSRRQGQAVVSALGAFALLIAFGWASQHTSLLKSVTAGLGLGPGGTLARDTTPPTASSAPTLATPESTSGHFSCESGTHTYLASVATSPGTARIVDEQVPRGVEEQTTGVVYIAGVEPGEAVQVTMLSAGGAASAPTNLTAPSAPC